MAKTLKIPEYATRIALRLFVHQIWPNGHSFRFTKQLINGQTLTDTDTMEIPQSWNPVFLLTHINFDQVYLPEVKNGLV